MKSLLHLFNRSAADLTRASQVPSFSTSRLPRLQPSITSTSQPHNLSPSVFFLYPLPNALCSVILRENPWFKLSLSLCFDLCDIPSRFPLLHPSNKSLAELTKPQRFNFDLQIFSCSPHLSFSSTSHPPGFPTSLFLLCPMRQPTFAASSHPTFFLLTFSPSHPPTFFLSALCAMPSAPCTVTVSSAST